MSAVNSTPVRRFWYDPILDVCFASLDHLGFPGYRVGDDGSVWSRWATCRSGRLLKDRWKRMKPSPCSKGYVRVNLVPADARPRTWMIHKIALTAFAGPCPPGNECRHLNGVKADNHLTNVGWGTPEQNRADNRRLGAYQVGERHSMVKLTESGVLEIRRRYAAGGVTLQQLGDEFGVVFTCVAAVVHRRSWKHV